MNGAQRAVAKSKVFERKWERPRGLTTLSPNENNPKSPKSSQWTERSVPASTKGRGVAPETEKTADYSVDQIAVPFAFTLSGSAQVTLGTHPSTFKWSSMPVPATRSRYRSFPAFAFPFPVLAVALVGKINAQPPVNQTEVQVEILATGLDAHPPLIVRHLLKVNLRTIGHDFVERRSTISQLALSADFD